MDVFLDTYYNNNTGDTRTVELNDINDHKMYVAFREVITNLKNNGHTPTHMEVWDKNNETDVPYKQYTVEDIQNYFNMGMQDCKSIW